ncbi:MAG: hypothetical protein WA971_08650, partial [Microbacterium sp.]
QNATRGRTDSDGVVTSAGWQSRMRAEITLSSAQLPLQKIDPFVVELAPGENAVTVPAPVLPEGEVQVRMRVNGNPYSGGSVWLTQLVGGVSVSRAGTVADDVFTVRGYHGPAKIAVSSWRSGTVVHDVVIGADPVVIGSDVEAAENDHLQLDLRLQKFGAAEPGPAVTVDWSTAVHLAVRTEQLIDGVWKPVYGTTWADSRSTVWAREGALVRVCADAREAGGPAGCSEPVEIAERNVIHPVSLTLVSLASLAIDLVDRFGAPLAGPWRATVSDGIRSAVIRGEGPRFDHDLPQGGTYRVSITSLAVGGGGTVVAAVPQDTALLLPAPLVVGTPTGPFIGEGNALASVQGEVVPGDQVTLRATYRAAISVGEAEFRLPLPLGWQVLADGATLDGAAVPVREENGAAVVSLGYLSSGGEGVVRLVLRAGEEVGEQPVHATITTAQGREYPLGSTVVQVRGVSIEAPDAVRERAVTLSGRAPAGSTVTLFEGEQQVGVAVAGPSGWWEARIAELPVRPIGFSYRFSAQLDDGSSAGPAVVVYDPRRAALTEVAMLQDGRGVRFVPADGVARFPFVYRTDEPVEFELDFDRPELVTSATVRFGERSAEAVRGEDGVFRASFPLKFGQEGDVWVSFTSDSAPAEFGTESLGLPVTVDDVRELLPPALRDFSIDESSMEEDADGTQRVQVAGTLPPAPGTDQRRPISVSVTVTPMPDYTPGAATAAIARAIGVPVYDAALSISEDGSSGRASAVFGADAA